MESSQKAEEILALAQADPVAAAEQGRALAESAMAAGDARTAAIAFRAEGLARINLRDPPGALEALMRARDQAEAAADPEVHAGVLTTLAVAHLYLGKGTLALSTIEQAIARSAGLARARAEGQRAGILLRLGRFTDALEGFTDAIKAVSSAGELSWKGHFLTNRAITYGFTGEIDAAGADFQAALAAYEQANDIESVATGIRNLGYHASQAGDIPEALQRFDEAEELLRQLGIPPGTLPNDRCRVLLQAGLAREALRVAQRTRDEMTRTGMIADRPEVALTVARAALQLGDANLALAAASEAAHDFAAQSRPGWEASARQLELQARFRAGEAGRRSLKEAIRLTAELEATGHRVPAEECRLVAARMALAIGDTAAAETQLARTGWSRARATVDVRTHHHLVTALIRNARGDRRGAAAAIAAGLRIADRYRATLGALDARASLSRHTADLASLALDLALLAGRPRRVLGWLEAGRSAALRFPPVRPPDDAGLRRDLAELRRTSAQAAEADLEGTNAATLRRKESQLERDIWRRHLRVAGSGDGGRLPDVNQVIRRLRDRLLVTWAFTGDTPVRIAADDRRVRLVRDASLRSALVEADSLLATTRRTVSGRGSARSLEAAENTVRHGITALREGLLGDLPEDRRGVLLVPPARMQALPWSAILDDLPVVVAPSAAIWFKADRSRRRRGRTVAVAGPGLLEADEEASDVARRYSDRVLLRSRRSGADRVLAALEGATVAHFACHGTINAENPQFSSLHLADGPLNLYDLQLLDRLPHTVVLSACDLGVSSERAGEEVIGFTATLLAMGVATVIASVAPVPDSEATRRLMGALHQRLARGVRPARALLEARQSLNPKTFQEKLAAECFTCFGAG